MLDSTKFIIYDHQNVSVEPLLGEGKGVLITWKYVPDAECCLDFRYLEGALQISFISRARQDDAQYCLHGQFTVNKYEQFTTHTSQVKAGFETYDLALWIVEDDPFAKLFEESTLAYPQAA